MPEEPESTQLVAIKPGPKPVARGPLKPGFLQKSVRATLLAGVIAATGAELARLIRAAIVWPEASILADAIRAGVDATLTAPIVCGLVLAFVLGLVPWVWRFIINVRWSDLPALAALAAWCITFWLVLCGSWAAGIVGGLAMIFRTAKSARFTLDRIELDAPLAAQSEDLFSRKHIVSVVAEYITNPSLKCPRVAITAPLGSGKTTVANFIGQRLKDGGHLVARFEPWHYKSADDAREALIATVDDALGQTPRYRRRGARFRDFLLRTTRGLLDQFKWAQGVVVPIERLLRISRIELEAELVLALGRSRRLVILVDDFERVSVGIAGDLLMYVRQVLDISGISFIFLFEEGRLRWRLEEDKVIAPGDTEWLEKFFDFQRALATPETDAFCRLDYAVIGRLWGKDAEALAALRHAVARVQPHLPAIARERKRFLQTVSTWPLLPWPVPDGMSDELTLLLLLMEYEDAGVLEKLWRSPDHIQDLGYGHIRARFSKSAGSSPEPDLATKTSFLSTARQQALYQAARDAGHAAGDVSLHFHWLLFGGRPPEDEIWRRIARALEKHGVTEALDVCREDLPLAFRASTRARSLLLDEILRAPTSAQQDTLVSRAQLAAQLRGELQTVVTADGRLTAADFVDAANRFLGGTELGGVYVRLHAAEWQVLTALASTHPDPIGCWVGLQVREPRPPSGVGANARVSLVSMLEVRCAETLLQQFAAGTMFERPRGERDGPLEQHILFNRSSILVGGAKRQAFLAAIGSATAGTPGWASVLEYWNRLTSRASEGQTRALELCMDRPFVLALWQTITAQALSRRQVAVLTGQLELLAGVGWWFCELGMP